MLKGPGYKPRFFLYQCARHGRSLKGDSPKCGLVVDCVEPGVVFMVCRIVIRFIVHFYGTVIRYDENGVS